MAEAPGLIFLANGHVPIVNSLSQLPVPPAVGVRLRQARQGAGLTTPEAAGAAGVDSQLVFLIEHGQPIWGMTPGEATDAVGRICSALDVPVGPFVDDLHAAWFGSDLTGSVTAVAPDRSGSMAALRPGPTGSMAGLEPATRSIPPVSDTTLVPRDARGGPQKHSQPKQTGPHTGRKRPSRAVRMALTLTTLTAVAAGAGLVFLGGAMTGTKSGAAMAADAHARPSASPGALSAPALTITSPSSATYQAGTGPFLLDVSALAPCWVQIEDAAGHTLWAGTLSAGEHHFLSTRATTQVVLGSAGGRITVSSGGHHAQLTPPSAPYTYTFR